ncbi:MAG: exo-alpha-sialidase [Clostridiaceae bacterium]|nr:exo-alpha-sialidase [Clostridiaceae bacterium]
MRQVKIVDQGVVASEPDRVFGYYAWPTVTRDANGDLVVVCSGKRIMHVCPFGKVVMLKSKNEGKTWSAPMIPIDTPLDDRDAGIVYLGDQKLVVTTFNNKIEQQRQWAKTYKFGHGSDELRALSAAYLPNVDEKRDEDHYLGSLMALSEDNGHSWTPPYRAPVTAPHGPNRLRSGGLIYAGTPYPPRPEGTEYPIHVYRTDDLKHFKKCAEIPACAEAAHAYHNESHIIELPSGRLLLQVRLDERGKPYEERLFSIAQSVSDDGGTTWSPLRLTGADGAPPHLLLHSSGTLISAYGRRKPVYGIQAMFSRDEGDSWDSGYYLWDQGRNSDLGYPASIELDNHDIFTVFYAIQPGETLCSILWVRWQLPD